MTKEEFRHLHDLDYQCRRDLAQLLSSLKRTASAAASEINLASVAAALGRFDIWREGSRDYKYDTTHPHPKAGDDGKTKRFFDNLVLTKPPWPSASRETIFSFLRDLKNNVQLAQKIVDGEVENRSTVDLEDLYDLLSEVDEDEQLELRLLLECPTTELDELIKALGPIITGLFELGVLARRNIAIQLRTEIPAATEAIEELGVDNWSDFERFLYSHAGAGRGHTTVSAQIDMHAQRHARLLRRHGMEQEQILGKAGEEVLQKFIDYWRTVTAELEMAKSWAPILFAAIHQVNSNNMEIPIKFSKSSSGQKFDFDEPWTCPLCSDFLLLSTAEDWNAHILQDMIPYSCTFEDCVRSPMRTIEEWAAHEVEFHRKIWHCRHGARDATTETPRLFCQCSPDTIDEKMTDSTPGRFVAVYDHSNTDCVYCHDWALPEAENARGSEFHRHVGRHQEEIAVLTMTWILAFISTTNFLVGTKLDIVMEDPPASPDVVNPTALSQGTHIEANKADAPGASSASQNPLGAGAATSRIPWQAAKQAASRPPADSATSSHGWYAGGGGILPDVVNCCQCEEGSYFKTDQYVQCFSCGHTLGLCCPKVAAGKLV